MITRRLIYHFYLGDNWADNIANKCHFNCLEHFSYLFDESIIVISSNTASENDIIEVKQRFSSVIKSKILTFKVSENNRYYEADTFKTEIIDNAAKLDGITFFAHNKGVSNVLDNSKSKTAILSWICALYYYGLNFIDEVEKYLCSDPGTVFYGPYLMKENYIGNKNHIWYAGTFYWINTGRLLKNCESIPEITDREYAEWFPGELFDGSRLKSHNGYILNDSDLYRNWLFFAKNSALSEEEYNNFLSFKNKVSYFFSEYKYTILTCNFNNYEIMREISNPQDDVEYIYVTDDESIKSSTWKIIADHDLDGLTPFEKVKKVRENPFKYCSTNTCVRIDASIEVIGSIDKLVDAFYMSNCDIGAMVHPERDNVYDEYDKWISWRGVNPDEKENVINALEKFGCNLSIKGLYETGLMIYMNNVYTKSLLKKLSEALNAVGEVRVDQAVFSSVVNSFDLVYLFPMSHECIQSNALVSMEHNSCFTCVVHDIPEYGYVKNKYVKLYNIND